MQKDWDAAERILRTTMDRQVITLGEEHPDTLATLSTLQTCTSSSAAIRRLSRLRQGF